MCHFALLGCSGSLQNPPLRGGKPNLEGLSKLAHCRSVQDFAAVQSGLIRESLQHMVEDSRSIVEGSLRAVNAASKALAGPAQGNGAQGRGSSLAA